MRLGRYDVVGQIGRGGMGTVYEAIEREHGTRVALKTLTSVDPDRLRRFKHEFRAVADLAHPNLVPLYELGCDDDLWFFTMERLEGVVDIIEWIREAPTIEDTAAALPPSIDKVRIAFAQLVRGVHALHRAGLLHLDLKPSNVLVDRIGRVVVLDFGLVRSIEGGKRGRVHDLEDSTISGTPGWMAPEQFDGQNLSEATDWYAVGLLLYLGLTGVPAFPTSSPSLTRRARQFTVAKSPAERGCEVPFDLGALLDALLRTDPAERPRGDALVALVSSDAPAEAVRQLARGRFIGRDAECARLDAAFARVAAGGAAIVHATGPSGVGKSALLRELTAGLRRDEALVLRGRCYERETIPYKAFDHVIDELVAWFVVRPEAELAGVLPIWIAELARVFPVLAKLPAVIAATSVVPVALPVVELRRRAIHALRELIERLAAQRPLVLEIDDLQWADADSVALLLLLIATPMPRGLLIAATYRRDEALANAAVVRYLAAVDRADAEVVQLDLPPLSRADAEQLARATLAALDVAGDLAVAIARESAGVPFFIEALARHAARHGGATPAGVSLETVLAERVRSLPDPERRLLEVLSVANSPITLQVAFAVADLDSGDLRALWALRANHLVRCTGARTTDHVELDHDRMRESIVGYLATARIDELHLALGRALAALHATEDHDLDLFDAVRHLCSVSDLPHEARRETARLALVAGRSARRSVAFPLAYDCFRAGARLVDDATWETDYELAIALHGGAAEAAYLTAAWDALASHVEIVKRRARTVFDQLVGWEVAIDAAIARRAYDAAVDLAIDALRLFAIELPAHPSDTEIGAAVTVAMAALARVGDAGLRALPVAVDPEVVAVMRLESRISSAAYFARPSLFPLLACRQVSTSIERGLAPATPYALAVYAIVLNTLGMHREAHAWGQTALALLERFPGDRSYEARTRHVVHDLVCVWIVPLGDTIDDLRRVVDVGRATGDLEFAAYAAHAYVHNAFYAGRALAPLYEEAIHLGTVLRGFEEVNALHVHAPFEQLLRCFTGRAPDPARLVGEGFDETRALESARAAGSRSALQIIQMLAGMVRYRFGASGASESLEAARPFLDGVASTWHVPIFHQYAALAIHALLPEARAALRAHADADLAALRALAEHGPENFAHRATLVEAEALRADGDLDAAIPLYTRAIGLATTHGWLDDLGLAHELAARCRTARNEPAEATRHLRAARAAYARWGARAKVAQLDAIV